MALYIIGENVTFFDSFGVENKIYYNNYLQNTSIQFNNVHKFCSGFI